MVRRASLRPPMSAALRHASAIPVILNPAARSARAADRVDRVRRLSPRVEIHATTGAGDARRLARGLAEAGAPVVVAAGGDGTVNEVIAGLAEADAPTMPALGILPLGTMNVLALEHRLPVLSLSQCWQRIEAGHVREIELWTANGAVFAQMAGVGLDAAVVRHTTWQAKKKWGPFSYMATLVRLLDAPAQRVRVVTDAGEELAGSAVLLGAGRFYGGPIPAFPAARPDDGLIDVIVVHQHGPAAFGRLMADVVAGLLPEESTTATRRRVGALRIESDPPAPLEIDGELGGETPVEVGRHARRLRLIV